MSDEQKINTLINVGKLKVVEKIYDDLLSEPSKKASNALGTIINVGNTLLWPIKWVNERTRIYFENNLKKYEERLSEIPEEKIVEVPTEISMPILSRFTYTSNKELSDAFVKLLTSASSIDTINTAHPGFIQVLDRLTPDEAKLMKHMSQISGIPILSIKYNYDPADRSKFRWLIKDQTGIEDKIPDLTYKENIGIYLSNLVSLGLLQRQNYWYSEIEPLYDEIEKKFDEIITEEISDYPKPEKSRRAIERNKNMYILTDFGKLFIKACI